MIWFFSIFAFASEPTLSVKSLVYTETAVSLADVAELSDVSKDVVVLAQNFQLCDAPAKGEKRTFSARAMSELLRAFSNQLAKKNLSVKFVVPQSVTIERPRLELSEAIVRDQLLKAWGASCKECKLILSDLQLPVRTQVNDWELQIKKELPRGQFSVAIKINNKDLVWLKGRLEIQREVPVANRAIYFGERLTQADFHTEFRDSTFSNDRALKPEEIDGQRLKSPVRVNDIISRSQIEKEKALVKGSIVRLKSNDSSFEVSLEARAEQDGFVGDTVAVRNLQSQHILQATVTGKSEVLAQ